MSCCAAAPTTVASMSTSLFLFLLLLHSKAVLYVCFSLFPAELTALCLPLLPLQLKRFLGLCADPAALGLLPGIPQPPFGIVRCLPYLRFHSGAEEQLVIMLQDEFPFIAISGFSAKGDFADRQLSLILRSKTPIQKGSSKNTVRLDFMVPYYRENVFLSSVPDCKTWLLTFSQHNAFLTRAGSYRFHVSVRVLLVMAPILFSASVLRRFRSASSGG